MAMRSNEEALEFINEMVNKAEYPYFSIIVASDCSKCQHGYDIGVETLKKIGTHFVERVIAICVNRFTATSAMIMLKEMSQWIRRDSNERRYWENAR